MFEKIATIITAMCVITSLGLGGLICIIDLISYSITGHQLTPIPPFVIILFMILTPPISLILIYLGEWLDMIFNLKKK